MKIIITFLILICFGYAASAQHWVKVYSYNEYLGLIADSVLIPPQDTTFSNPTVGSLAIFNGHVYQRLSTAWSQVDGGGNAVQSLTGSQSIQYGAFNSMPSPGTSGRFYAATDSSRWYFDNGTAWLNLSGSGGMGGGSLLTFGIGIKPGSYNGSSAVTINADTIAMTTRNSLDSGLATKQTTSLSPGDVWIGNGSGVAQQFAVTGDFSFSSSGVGTINANSVTLTKQAQAPANTIPGNNTGSMANLSYLTISQVVSMLNVIMNAGGVNFLGIGPYASHPTSVTPGIWIANDSVQSGCLFYWNGSAMTNLTPQITLSVRGKGQPGDTTMITLSGTALTGFNLNVAAMRDSSGGCFHHVFNADGSITFYSTCVIDNGNFTGAQAGPLATRPAASNCQCVYWSTDSVWLSYDNGSWHDLKPGSGGGSGLSQIYAKAPLSVSGTDTAVADTNAQHLTALVTYNQVPLYNVMRFGAHRDSTYNNSTAFQAAVDTCYAHGGGTVFIPAGVWKAEIDRTNRAAVNIKGEGKGTVLKPVASGDTVIKDYNTNFPAYRGSGGSYAFEYGSGSISNLMIEGSNTASVGIYGQYNYWCTYDNLWIDSCANVGMKLKGSLTAEISHVTFKYSPVNLFLDTINLAGGLVAPNLVACDDIHNYWASQWGFKVLNTQGLVSFRNIDCSDNGTLHNPNTGGFYIGSAQGPNVTAEWDNCWFEANKGTLIYCQSPAGGTQAAYNLKHVLFFNNSNASVGLYASAAGIPAYFSISDSYMQGDSVDIVLGGGTHIINNGGFSYGTTSVSAATNYLYIKDNSKYDIPYLRGSSGTPFISSTGTGAGASGATASLSSWASSLGFDVTINVTSGATPSTTMVIVGYDIAWVNTGLTPTLTPVNALAASLGGDALPLISFSGTYNYPTITSGKIALLPGTYIFHVTEVGK